ncbi:MAG: S-adenosylmethionine:tRNA ribosyltransferase-isomerase, partial [Candidatus Cloacimonetes bacterium]|nr:S-adenosylmethionine:tRNA ribosyltransferase-isomerase [Candidatus Cloacimonadota bacterium]
MTKYKLSDFDYYLPPERIAQYPSKKRIDSKLMILNRTNKKIETDKFFNIINYFDGSDLLVLNETKVIPARLIGKKLTGGKIEILLLEQIDKCIWKCLIKPGRRLKIGSTFIFNKGNLIGKIIEFKEQGERVVEFSFDGDFFDILEKIGKVPLP